MVYMGSKNKLAKELLPIILKDKDKFDYYVEPFVGGMNMIDKVIGIKRIGADNNKYLIAMWKALQQGWQPPKEITKEFYDDVRNCYKSNCDKYTDAMIGWVGFNMSYRGKFFGGFRKTTKSKDGKIRNYMLEAYNNIMKQLPKILDVELYCCSYDELVIPEYSIIYCDPPYRDTTGYLSDFDYEKFYNWCIDKQKEGHQVFISEYYMPEDKFECIWQKEVKVTLETTNTHNRIEKLFIPKN